uniref:TIGR00267 family protein n=1 Tax=Geoglobus ahangari TaxID=113653 RepID=A0A7C4S553_9EURY
MRIRYLFEEKIKKYKIYTQITDLFSISRRYFVIGFFDGVLTVMGMVLGAHLSGKATKEIILSAGIATSLALGISSGWGAYEAERVEQKLTALEKKRALLMMNEKKCLIEEAHTFAMRVSSLIHAIAPIPAGIIPLIPYIFLPENLAFLFTLAIGFLLLFIVGIALGNVSKENVLKSGVRLVLAGIVTLVIVTILSPAHY